MKIRASAPSNIALVKYMGKTDATVNKPLNASLSWTLEGLRSEVEIEHLPGAKQDTWEPLGEVSPLRLSEKGIEKFLAHVERIRKHFGRSEKFLIRSKNNFPSDAGIASSASSFAALTMGVCQALQALDPKVKATLEVQSDLSRQGSGSSCRSFYGPWSLWDQEGARAVELGINDLHHQVILVDSGVKTVSSSDAHKRCATSELFAGRKERAEKRLSELVASFKAQDWEKSFQTTWAEFWDMHALFETSKPAFGYLKPGTLTILDQVQSLWRNEKDGPIATLDAGPNVHLLWRNNQLINAQDFAASLDKKYSVLSTWAGSDQVES